MVRSIVRVPLRIYALFVAILAAVGGLALRNKLRAAVAVAVLGGGTVALVETLTVPNGPQPNVGLTWFYTGNPTSGGGIQAPMYQFLIRVDVPSVYWKSGTAATAWTIIGNGASPGTGTVTSITCGSGVTCTPNPITTTGTITADGSAPTGSGSANAVAVWVSASVLGYRLATDDGTTFKITRSEPGGRANIFDVINSGSSGDSEVKVTATSSSGSAVSLAIIEDRNGATTLSNNANLGAFTIVEGSGGFALNSTSGEAAISVADATQIVTVGNNLTSELDFGGPQTSGFPAAFNDGGEIAFPQTIEVNGGFTGPGIDYSITPKSMQITQSAANTGSNQAALQLENSNVSGVANIEWLDNTGTLTMALGQSNTFNPVTGPNEFFINNGLGLNFQGPGSGISTPTLSAEIYAGTVNKAGFQLWDGSSLGVADFQAGRMRYNAGLGHFEASFSGNPWAAFGTSTGTVTSIACGTGVSCSPGSPITSTGTITGAPFIGETVTSGTSGSVLYLDSSIHFAQDNADLFYDAADHRLGLGKNSGLGNALTVVDPTAGGSPLVVQSTSATGFSVMDALDNSGTQQMAIGYGNPSASATRVQSKTYLFSASADFVVTNSTQNQFVFGETTGSATIEFADGSASAVSDANTGRIEYNNVAHEFEASVNGGAYVPFASATGGVFGTGTANRTTKWSGASTVGNGWASDDGTTWGSAGIFTITEASGNFKAFGTGEIAGAATFDSTGSFAGAVNMNSNKVTSLANGVASSDAAAFGQIASAVNTAVSCGTSNALVKSTGTHVSGCSAVTDDGTTTTVTDALTTDALTTVATTLSVGLVVSGNSTDQGIQLNNTASGGRATIIGEGATASGFPGQFYLYDNSGSGLLFGLTGSSKAFHFTGAGTLDSTLSVGGAENMNSHQINNVSNGTGAQDAAAFGQIAASTNAAVSGTSGTIAVFNGAHSIGNGNATDSGGVFTVDEDLVVSLTTAGTTFEAATTASALTATVITVLSATAGTFNTTGGALSSYGMQITNGASRSSGANNLTNYGLYANVFGAQVNYAIYADAGNVKLNATSGTTEIVGAGTLDSTLAVTGLSTLTGGVLINDAGAAGITVNGNGTTTPAVVGTFNGEVDITDGLGGFGAAFISGATESIDLEGGLTNSQVVLGTATGHSGGIKIGNSTNPTAIQGLVKLGAHELTTATAFSGSSKISACGTGSPAFSSGSTDLAGTVTEGGLATGCVITFNATYTNPPFCTATAGTATAVGVTTTATTMSFVNASATGDVITWRCTAPTGST
jgi:hypothetical protein